MKGLRLTRREMLAGAGVVLTGTALFGSRERAKPDSQSIAGPGATVILQSGAHSLPRERMRRFAGDNALVIQLEADPVRQWRGTDGLLLAARSTRLLGVSTWPQFLIVRGLAEESGRRVRFQRSDGPTGTMTWLIA